MAFLLLLTYIVNSTSKKEMFILTSSDDINMPCYLKTLISKIHDLFHDGFPQKLLENLSIFTSILCFPRREIMEPTHVSWVASSLIMPPKYFIWFCLFWVFLGMMPYERGFGHLQGVLWELKFFVYWWKYEVTFCFTFYWSEEFKFWLEGLRGKNKSSKRSFYLYE
jgi:hypothetical protein